MAVTAPESEDLFLQQLVRGGELLAAGRLVEAREQLERAQGLQPNNEKGQNLLGLAYFKLGQFDRAAAVYEALVRENAADPTLRVNLGLVYLKSAQVPRAVREFEQAVQLAPEHAKAHNYLGLALAQAGDYAKAREHFLKSGSDSMAEKMTRALAADGAGRSEPTAAQTSSPTPAMNGRPPAPESPVVEPLSPPRLTPVTRGWSPAPLPRFDSSTEAWAKVPPNQATTAPWPVLTSAAAVHEAITPVPAPAPPTVDTREMRFAEDEGPSALAGDEEVQPVEEEESLPEPVFGEPAPDDGDDEARMADESPAVPPAGVAGSAQLVTAGKSSPFEVRDDAVLVSVQTELLLRTDGWVGFSGPLQFQPELKRFRGRATDRSFGDGTLRMMRVSGKGVAWVHAGARTFLAVTLGQESAYLREEWVYGFEEMLSFENGQVPSDEVPELNLVHLSGEGQVLLCLPGSLRSLEVRADVPVTVPLQHWVGWQGQLSPRIVGLPWDGPSGGAMPAVELSGEGFALVCVAMG